MIEQDDDRSTAAQGGRSAMSWTRRRTGTSVVAVAAAIVAVVAVLVAAGGDTSSTSGELSLGSAVLLGLIEGTTEYLPVSSTGHVMVAQELLGLDGDAADSYAIAIQAGAILAVLGLYRSRFAAMLRGVRGADPVGRQILTAVVVAFVPAAAVGFVLGDVIKDRLFGPRPVIVAWFVGGVAILIVARRRRDVAVDAGAPLSALSWRGALVIGSAQILALWPGVSRSLVTILAATGVGLTVSAAVEFSFLLGFFTLGAATVYEMMSAVVRLWPRTAG